MTHLRVPLHVVTGAMFSGKTTELLCTAERLFFQHTLPILCKPHTDTRDGPEARTHAGWFRPAQGRPVRLIDALEAILVDVEANPDQPVAVLVDEAQFLEPEPTLAALCQRPPPNLVGWYFFGLNLDARGNPWSVMREVLPLATSVRVLEGVCKQCLGPATRTQRLTPWPGDSQVAVGAAQDYEPRCVRCFDPR